MAAAALLVCAAAQVGYVQSPSGFPARIAQLSEPGGYFDTDNLISNERSYLQVMPALRKAGITGGAYVGVGPDLNFTYIAQVRPSIAFIIDVRRDNLLLHLLFKALFQLSETRVEYLSLLFGRPVPERLNEWRHAGIDRLVAYIENTKPASAANSALRLKVDAVIRGFGVPLSSGDFATIDRFHRSFIDGGMLLKFETFGRGSRSYYPTYRELLLETDGAGHQCNFLASEGDFQFVCSLEQRELVIPVVGNLSGSRALAAVGRMMEERGDRLSVFYSSNIEFYLFRDNTFSRFVENLSHLPHTSQTLIIRSVFAGVYLLPTQPGYASASIVQPMNELLQGYAAGKFREYRELITAR